MPCCANDTDTASARSAAAGTMLSGSGDDFCSAKLECAVAAAHFVRGQQVDHFVLQQQLVQQQPQRVLRGG